MTANRTTDPSSGRSPALWAGVLGAPIAWAVQFQANYALVPWVCWSRKYFVMHLVSALFLALALGGLLISWRDWRRAGCGSPDTVQGGPLGREQFVSGLGIAVSLLFSLLIVAQGIASFFIDACWD